MSGRRYSASRVGAESPASVMSSSGRTGRGAVATAAAPAARAGANVAEVGDGLGMATGILVAGSPLPPQMPVWPSDVPPATAAAPRRPFPVAVALAAPIGDPPFGAGGDSRFMLAAVTPPSQRAEPVRGRASSAGRRANAIMRPITIRPTSRMNAPGPVTSGTRSSSRKRPIRPPPRSTPRSSTLRTSRQPRKPMNAIARPMTVAPQPEFGFRPGPHSRYQPALSSRNGSSQRPVSNQGAIESRYRSVSSPSPGSSNAMSVTAPSRRNVMPTIERAISGLIAGKRTEGSPLLRRRLRGVACRLVEVRRRVAILRPRPRPERPSGVALSARTGNARRRP